MNNVSPGTATALHLPIEALGRARISRVVSSDGTDFSCCLSVYTSYISSAARQGVLHLPYLFDRVILNIIAIADSRSDE